MLGKIAELTKRQTGRYYFENIPIGTKFIIVEENLNMPAYDVTGYFLNYPPQHNGEKYHFTGYIEKGTYKVLGEVKDNINLMR